MADNSSIQSADRLFQIMELLSRHPRGMGLMEICSQTQLPKGTVSRMLSALGTNGYAVQDPESRKYRLTMRMFEIGSRVAGCTDLLAAARPCLRELAARTGETVHLVRRVQDEVVYLYKEEGGASAVRMASYVGLRNPMHCTGVGKSILAFLPDPEIAAIWARTEVTAFTPHTIVTWDALEAEVTRIRAQGYALDLQEHELGVCCVSAPVLDLNGEPVAAISISAPTLRMDRERLESLAPMVLEAARTIAQTR